MPICFVTSCGTGRGKTYVSEKLISDWRAVGETVDVLKPVISGFEMKTAAESDTGLLLKAAGYDVTEETIYRTSPWRYEAPLSPDMAAAREGHLEVLQWARRNGCPWEETTCSGAAGQGHMEVLQ